MSNPKPISKSVILALIDLAQSQAKIFLASDRSALSDLFSECQTENQIMMLKELLSKFNYLTSSELQEGAKEIALAISQKWALNPKDTLIVAISDGDRTDGSQYLVKSVETALARAGTRFDVRNQLGPAFHEVQNKKTKYKNIVILDDFIGTGGKVSGVIERLQKYITHQKIYIASLAGMNFGIDHISKSCGCDIFSFISYKKSISDEFLEPKRSAYISAMIELEERIIPPSTYPRNSREKCYMLGYGESEALYFLEGFSVPNNVFPIFWKNQYCDRADYLPDSSGKPFKKTRHARNPILTRA